MMINRVAYRVLTDCNMNSMIVPQVPDECLYRRNVHCMYIQEYQDRTYTVIYELYTKGLIMQDTSFCDGTGKKFIIEGFDFNSDGSIISLKLRLSKNATSLASAKLLISNLFKTQLIKHNA